MPKGKDVPEVEALTLNASQAAELIGISSRTLGTMRRNGEIPAPVKVHRRNRWRRAELEQWIRAGCPAADTWKELRAAIA